MSKRLVPERSGGALRAPLLAAALAAVLLLAGCGGAPAAPGGFDYTGSWRGTINDDVTGTGTIIATLQQTELALTGTWHTVMGADPARQDGGSWTGQVFVGQEGDLVEVSLSPAVAGGCSYRLTLTRTNETLAGDYAAVGAPATCPNFERGTVQLGKQL